MANVQYYDVILKPVVTEKSMNAMSEKKYTFLVHPEANKTMIKEAVEKMFPGTKVASVNTQNLDGKNKRRGMRVGVIKDWDSRWYAEADFADNLIEDHEIRTYLKKRLYSAGISKIEIERASDRIKIIVHTAKPGVVIGKGGAEIEKLKAEVQKMTDKKLFVDIKEVKRPDRDAQLVAESIAQQLENRVSFRRAMKSTMGRSMKAGVLGIKTAVGGRLGGADIARTEFYSEGTIPLQTLRADIDYGFAEADTTYGKLGVKVWIYKGEVLPTKGNKEGSDK